MLFDIDNATFEVVIHIAVIPRSTKPEHIRENFALFDFTLTPDEMAQLSALDRIEPLIGKPETPELVEFSLTW